LSAQTPELIRFGHSPDADDAFMFYGLAKEIVTIPGKKVVHVLDDIQSLNRRAMGRADLEVTAISTAVYPRVAEKYRIMSTGASMGRGYGPQVVRRADRQELHGEIGRRIAFPGEQTTAFLLLRLYLGPRAAEIEFMPVQFDKIFDAVQERQVDSGLIIHEGQLTHEEIGLKLVVDLGRWWEEETGLPIPVGLDVVRRDLGESLGREINTALHRSIEIAYKEEEAALDYALSYGRGIDRETCRAFVKMYVNQDTLDLGKDGKEALEQLFVRAHRAGLVNELPQVDVLDI
jgi:1,4-dihydroxy-6-naphthoate synthase